MNLSKKYKAALASSVILLLFFSSCRKNIEAGIVTTISGQISDSVVGVPVANASILIIQRSSNCFICRERPSGIVDSAFSDANGNYRISFETTGSASSYEILLFAPEHYSGSVTRLVTPGRDTTIHMQVIKLKWLKANIAMENIPYKPLSVHTGYDGALVHNFPADTTIYLEAPMNRKTYIEFRYTHPDTSWIYYSGMDTTTTSNSPDTAELNFTLDTSTFLYRGGN